jgi:type I restriction enzyme, S subunit
VSHLPSGWSMAEIADLFETLEDGRTLHQGWSPQCERVASQNDREWAVLKTTAIQPAAFLPNQNKLLPSHLAPRTQYEVRQGDLLITCAGPRARCGISCFVRTTRPRLMLSGKMYRFRLPEQHVSARYVEYYLQSAEAISAIDRMKTGGSDSGLNLTTDRFRKLSVPLAPRTEQVRIVRAIEEQFSKLEAGVAALESVHQKRWRMRTGVLRAAVTGRLSAGWRASDRSVHAAKHISVIDESVSPSEGVGELPIGWRRSRLGDLVVDGPQNGLYLPAARYGRGTPILRIIDFQDGWIQRRDALQLVTATPADIATFGLQVGDIIINRVNSMTHLGKCLAVTQDLAGAIFESNMMRFRVNDDIDNDYLTLYLQSDVGRMGLLANAKQAVNQASINQTDVKQTMVAIPPRDEQVAIRSLYAALSASLDSIARASETAIARTRRLRSSILAAAFSGELAPQDPSDEPASLLLERIAADRASSNGFKKTTAPWQRLRA